MNLAQKTSQAKAGYILAMGVVMFVCQALFRG